MEILISFGLAAFAFIAVVAIVAWFTGSALFVAGASVLVAIALVFGGFETIRDSVRGLVPPTPPVPTATSVVPTAAPVAVAPTATPVPVQPTAAPQPCPPGFTPQGTLCLQPTAVPATSTPVPIAPTATRPVGQPTSAPVPTTTGGTIDLLDGRSMEPRTTAKLPGVDMDCPPYRDTGVGKSASYTCTIPEGWVMIVGGVKVDEFDKGALKAFGPGRVTVNVVDGFYTIKNADQAPDEFCTRLTQARQNGWLATKGVPLAGWSLPCLQR